MRLGFGLVMMGIIFFCSISIPVRFYSPEAQLYKDATQPAVAREAIFAYWKPACAIGGVLVVGGLAAMGVSKIGTGRSSSWRSRRKT